VTLRGFAGRLWPANLAGRVFLIVIAGLAVAMVTSYFFFEMERTRAIDRFSAAEIAARIADGARTNSHGTGPGREDGPWRHRIHWKDVDGVGDAPSDGESPSSGFTAELRRLLTENFGEDPVAWLSVNSISAYPGPQRPFVMRIEPGDGKMPLSPPPDVIFRAAPGTPPGTGPPQGMGAVRVRGAFDRPHFLTVALKLPDGRKALVEAPLLQAARGLPQQIWSSVALIFAVTALFTLAAVRLAVQPVRMLGAAADRLSRNIDEPPLPEKGAADIRAAARAFNRMQDRLRRHVNSRTLAFAAMSHDIRTPLTRMRLKLESLGEDARKMLGGDLNEIEALAKSALEMTRDLAPDEGIVPVDVNALVNRLATDYEPMGVKIPVTGTSPAVKGRPAALRRALGNLIDNAIKYGREVAITLGEGREHAVIEILDRGPGIPVADLEKVVYPFYRVESSRNRETGGAGLGLAIAKDIVEGQGGELAIANRAGGGLAVTVRLPR
jgi:signal transduction histidine kinase